MVDGLYVASTDSNCRGSFDCLFRSISMICGEVALLCTRSVPKKKTVEDAQWTNDVFYNRKIITVISFFLA